VDLFLLRPGNILSAVDGMKWIKTARKKTEIPVNIPLLKPALEIVEKFKVEEGADKRETLFPMVSEGYRYTSIDNIKTDMTNRLKAEIERIDTLNKKASDNYSGLEIRGKTYGDSVQNALKLVVVQ
jgi:hypothetical protein